MCLVCRIAYLLFFFTTLRRSDRKSPDYESSQDENPGKGVVTDKSGEPLIGATIVEKASGNGTIADRTGTSTWQSRRMPCLKSALSGISPSKSK